MMDIVISTSSWGWPQWVATATTFISLMLVATMHGAPRSGNYNVFASMISAGATYFILICGGFFS